MLTENLSAKIFFALLIINDKILHVRNVCDVWNVRNVRNFFDNLIFFIFQVVECVCGHSHIPHLKPPGTCPRPVVGIGNMPNVHTRWPLHGNYVLV